LYHNGEGVGQDSAQAVRWFKKAAVQGHAVAQNNVGGCYYNGDGVEQDYRQAVEWFEKAAEQGHKVAQNNLGECYYYVNGVSSSFEEAVRWFIKAAEQEEVNAQYNLGICYTNGTGTTPNDDQAFMWFLKAAEQDHVEAVYTLGRYCFFGIGTAIDVKQSFQWLNKAIELGHPDARKMIEEFTETLETERKQAMKNRTEVFISYTHKDTTYLDELNLFLKSLILDHNINIWYDKMLKSGDEWKTEIREHMSVAKVAILFVSQAFLVSEFVRNEELPELLQAAKDDKATIMWIPVGVSRVNDTHIKGKK